MLQGDIRSTLLLSATPLKSPPAAWVAQHSVLFLAQRMHFSWLCLWHYWGHQPCHQSLPALVPGTRVQQHLHPPQLCLVGATTGRSKAFPACLLPWQPQFPPAASSQGQS